MHSRHLTGVSSGTGHLPDPDTRVEQCQGHCAIELEPVGQTIGLDSIEGRDPVGAKPLCHSEKRALASRF